MQLSKKSNISLRSSHYVRTEQSFLVPFAEIKANDWDLSINKYKEVVYEAVQYDSPAKLLANIRLLDMEREEILKVLEGLLI